MIENTTELAEIISTRISHDLIGNIGALSNAMELINEQDNCLDEETLKIIKTAAETLKARQKFFRMAFGLDTKNISLEELKEVCENYLLTLSSKMYPLQSEFRGASSELAKFLCLSVMIGAEVCIRGGNIKVAVDKNNMTISVKSDYNLSAAKIADYQNILQNMPTQENLSQYAPLVYLRELLGENVKMRISSGDTFMELVIG